MTVTRFKNYEAGRLTSMITQPDNNIPSLSSVTLDSKTSSQKSLATPSNDGKFSETTEVDAQDKVGQEECMFVSLRSQPVDDADLETVDVYARIFNFTAPGCDGPTCKNTRPATGASKIYARPFSFPGKFDKKDATGSKVALLTTTEEIDPRRRELDAIKSLFLVPSAPKELNIPSSMRKKVLAAIENSTDASHLEPIAEHCHILLKSCSHRNFIRLGVSNGTFETICMATGLGIVLTVMGFLTMLILAFASPSFRHSSRWRGLGVWPMWSVGGGLILSGLRGSCFFLLLFSRRQPLPWERFEDDAIVARERSRLWALVSKLMIFDRKLKVKDDNLRALQRKVVIQSLFGGMLFASLMTIFFLSLPIWKEV
jgi:hypothetical protein